MVSYLDQLDSSGADERAARLIQYSRTRTVEPTEEPVTLDDFRGHGRVDDGLIDDDAQLEEFISAARERVEQVTGAAILTQTWRFRLDAFPDYSQPFYLPKSPLQSITSIQYIDLNGATQTLAASTYKVNADTDPATWPNRVALAYGQSWPSSREEIDAVTITAICGWSTVASVPRAIKQTIKMLALYWYDRRAAAEFLQGADIKSIPYSVEALLAEYRVRWFA